MASRAQQIAARIMQRVTRTGPQKQQSSSKKGSDSRYKDFAREIMQAVKTGNEDRLAQTLEEFKGL